MKLRTILPVVIAIGALALPAGAVAAKGGKGKTEEVTVMSRNLYLGADLNPALGADTIDGAIDGAGVVYNQLVRTDYPQRAVALAAEIKKAKPDLVGLQEVAQWHEQIPSDNGGPPIGPGTIPASDLKYDFLATLEDELKAAGAKYTVAGVQQEFTGELPADIDGNDATGAGLSGADLDIRLTMRDAILVRKGVEAKKFKSANYENRFETTVAGAVTVGADRGWTSVEAKVGKAKFRFANTHIESFDDGSIKEAQVKELLQEALKGKGTKIVVGDFNSDPADSGPNGAAYDAMEAAGYERRVLKGFTFGHTADVNDPNDAAGFDTTIDHVFTSDAKVKLVKKGSALVGNTVMTPGGLWPSDHLGVVSRLSVPVK